MADLQSGYNVPGVYVRDTTGPMLTSAGFPESIVTLVGPAVGYQITSEVIEVRPGVVGISGGSLFRNTGIWIYGPTGPDSQPTGAPTRTEPMVLKTLAGQTLTQDEDYVLHVAMQDAADLVDPLYSVASSRTTLYLGPLNYRLQDGDLVAVPQVNGVPQGTHTKNGLTPDAANRVVATYYYTNAEYYNPTLFEDFDQVEAVYGDALLRERPTTAVTSEIVSPLSFAALVAFANGASRVMCVATNPTPVLPEGATVPVAPSLLSQMRTALNKTEGDYRTDLVVPIMHNPASTGAVAEFKGYADLLKEHVEASSEGGFQRFGIIGAPANYGKVDALSVPNFDSVAPQIGSHRVIMAYPNRLNFYNTGTSRTIEVDGFYLAVAYAARLAQNPVQVGLTRQQMYGFAGFPATINRLMTKDYKDRLSESGVAVAEIDRQNRLIVRHGLTTNTKSVITREPSITRARDALFESLQIGLDSSGLIGSPIDLEMTTRVKGAVQGILETAVQDGTIIAYADLKVRQQSFANGGDPTVIEAKFAYQPAVPLNYILVSFSLNLTSGAVSVTNLAA